MVKASGTPSDPGRAADEHGRDDGRQGERPEVATHGHRGVADDRRCPSRRRGPRWPPTQRVRPCPVDDARSRRGRRRSRRRCRAPRGWRRRPRARTATRRPAACPAADSSSSVVDARRCRRRRPCADEPRVERVQARGELACAICRTAWPTTPATTSQIEPTTTAVSAEQHEQRPTGARHPAGLEPLDERGEERPEHAAMTRGTTKPDTCDSSHSTAAANASTPTSSHDAHPPPHQAGRPGHRPAGRGSHGDAPPPRRRSGHLDVAAIVGPVGPKA